MKTTLSTFIATVLVSTFAYANVCPLKYGKAMNRYTAAADKTNYYSKASKQKTNVQVNSTSKVNLHK